MFTSAVQETGTPLLPRWKRKNKSSSVRKSFTVRSAHVRNHGDPPRRGGGVTRITTTTTIWCSVLHPPPPPPPEGRLQPIISSGVRQVKHDPADTTAERRSLNIEGGVWRGGQGSGVRVSLALLPGAGGPAGSGLHGEAADGSQTSVTLFLVSWVSKGPLRILVWESSWGPTDPWAGMS